MAKVLTIILAGGRGERLHPLTETRAKPAVPFGGVYRIIDFTLSNCLHSGLRQILVLTQYKSQSLSRHLRHAWSGFHHAWEGFLEVVPPQQRVDDRWYEGTADAVYHNRDVLEHSQADDVLILSGDHVYAMDYRPLLEAHRRGGSPVTVACVPVPLAEGSAFGVMQIDARLSILAFQEKPASPQSLPDDPQRCLASMGVYVFKRRYLLDLLAKDGGTANPRLDFGRHVLPQAIGSGEVRAYPFLDPQTGLPGYWRDVGTVDAYFQASRELLAAHPPILPQDRAWRVHGHVTSTAPSIVDCREGGGGFVDRSLLGPGSLVRDAYVANSIVSADVEVLEDAEISEAILFEGVSVGAGVRLRRTIVDKGVAIPRGTKVGFDAAWDRARGLHVTDAGVTVVPKGYVFGRERRDGAAELSRTMHVRSNAVGASPRT